MSFDIPPARMLAVKAAKLTFDPSPHPYEALHCVEIDANWRREIAANPALFDGRVMLFSSIVWRDDMLEATCHSGNFASFMHWRLTRTSPLMRHMFAHAMLVAADGSLVAVRMGAHTANAGRVYFAAGSFDDDDLIGGEIDIDSNMRREVLEETGIDINGLRSDAVRHAFCSPAGTVIVRRYFLPWDHDEIARRVRAHIGRDEEPEIEDVVFICRGEPLPDNLAQYMPALIDWHFSRQD